VRATARWREIEQLYPDALSFATFPLPELLAGVNALRGLDAFAEPPAGISPLLSVRATKSELVIWSGRMKLQRLVALRRSEIVGTDATSIATRVQVRGRREFIAVVRVYVFRAGGILELLIPLAPGTSMAAARALADRLVEKMGIRLIDSRRAS
jgi:hypothetical protein